LYLQNNIGYYGYDSTCQLVYFELKNFNVTWSMAGQLTLLKTSTFLQYNI